MKEGFNTKNQCSQCNSMCRTEGWSECWDLCTCECHTKAEEKNISFNLSVSGQSELLLDFVRWQNRCSKWATISENMVDDYLAWKKSSNSH